MLRRRKSNVTVPTRAHPFAKLVFAEMRRQSVRYDELEHRSGVLASTFKAWRSQGSPSLASAEATLGALGWTLVPVPKLEALPDNVRAALDEIGQHFRSNEETFGAAILAAAEFPARAQEGVKQLELARASCPPSACLSTEGARCREAGRLESPFSIGHP